MNKREIVRLLRASLEEEIAAMAKLALDAAEAATHEENKPENDKDMRSTEASYLARGQAARVQELERTHALLGAMELREFEPEDAIESSAVVTLSQAKKQTHCFLAPAGGGLKVKVEGIEIQVVTKASPLGEALIGLSEGDEAEVPTPQGPRVYTVVKVR
jgi:transcription elongation GreA/GreB family factor